MAKILSILDKDEAKKLINHNILCANSEQGMGNFAMLMGIDESKGKFKCRMTGGKDTDKSWYHSIRYYKYIVEE